MCLCMYKIYILYYLDSLAFSAKRVKKNFGTRFLIIITRIFTQILKAIC